MIFILVADEFRVSFEKAQKINFEFSTTIMEDTNLNTTETGTNLINEEISVKEDKTAGNATETEKLEGNKEGYETESTDVTAKDSIET